MPFPSDGWEFPLMPLPSDGWETSLMCGSLGTFSPGAPCLAQHSPPYLIHGLFFVSLWDGKPLTPVTLAIESSPFIYFVSSMQ